MNMPSTAPEQRCDHQLIHEALGGDTRARVALLERHMPAIQRQLLRFPLDASDRHDLAQDAVLQVIRKLDTFRGDSQFTTWVYRITANAALMRLRSDRRRRHASLEDHASEAEHSLALAVAMPGGEWSERADTRFDLAQRRARLERALASLPAGYREVVLGHYVDGESLQAVADRLGATESAVRSRLHRARTALRHALADLAPSRGDASVCPRERVHGPHADAMDEAA